MPLYTIDEAAALMKVDDPDTVRNWIREGRLRASKLSGTKTIRISEDDIKDFYNANATIPRPDLAGV